MDFVTFDIAKKLKEKGFLSACIGHYEGEGFEYNTYDGFDINISYIARSYNDDNRFDEYTDVPVICQVLKWLRETKNIEVVASFSYGNKVWGYQVGDMTLLEDSILSYDYSFQTYEEAALAGIEYVLDNLI